MFDYKYKGINKMELDPESPDPRTTKLKTIIMCF